MKPTLFAISFLFAGFSMNAQTDTLLNNFHSYFGQLNTDYMSTNVLIDRAPIHSGINYFDGAYDTVIPQENWWQIYLDIYNSCYDEELFIFTPVSQDERTGYLPLE